MYTHTHIHTAQAQSGVKEVTFPALSGLVFFFFFWNKHQCKHQPNNQAIFQTPWENVWCVEKSSSDFRACPRLTIEAR